MFQWLRRPRKADVQVDPRWWAATPEARMEEMRKIIGTPGWQAFKAELCISMVNEMNALGPTAPHPQGLAQAIKIMMIKEGLMRKQDREAAGEREPLPMDAD